MAKVWLKYLLLRMAIPGRKSFDQHPCIYIHSIYTHFCIIHIHLCIYIYIYSYIHLHIYIYFNLFSCIFICLIYFHIFTLIFIYLHLFSYIYIYFHMFTFIYIRSFTYVSICIKNIYIYIYIHLLRVCIYSVFLCKYIYIYISCVFISVDICVFRFDMKQRLICHLHRSEGWMGLSFVSLLWDHLLSQVVHLRLFSYTDDTAPFPCLPPSTKRLWGKHIVCERVAGDDSVASVIGEGLVWPSLSRVILTERACVAKRKMGLADWCWCECDRRAQWKSIYIYMFFFEKNIQCQPVSGRRYGHRCNFGICRLRTNPCYAALGGRCVHCAGSLAQLRGIFH